MSAVATLVGMVAGGKGAKFGSLTYRAKETGELAKYVLILGASTETLYKKDVAILKTLLAGDTLSDLEREAATALLKSREESLTVGIGNNSKYVHAPHAADTYVHADGIPGVKIHKETGVVYVTALVEDKTVLQPGTYKEVKSKPLTLAKKAVEKNLPSRRFRQFILKNVTRAALNGDVLEIDAE